ncbi:MFS transporter [Enterobacterales bacterium]|nr:MFS transporter [Enterobacterales bacterium]
MAHPKFHAASHATGQLSVLFTVCLAGMILPLNFVSGAVATPAIARELGGSAQALSWITNAFMLTFGCFLMAAGALADEFGRKKVFICGVAGFGLLSLLQSFSTSLLAIDLLRGAQGILAAAALAGGSAALAQEFDGPARTRAFSLLGTSFGVGLAFGPFLAGLLIAHFGWRSVFLSSTVIALLSLLTGAWRMQESRNPDAAGIDWPGTLSFTAMLALLTWALMDIPQYGLQSTQVLVMLGGAALLLVLFIGIAGLSEQQAGLMMMALSLPMLAVPLMAAWLTRWISAGVLCTSGLVLAALGLGWLSVAVDAQNLNQMIFPMLLIGLGTGLPWGLMDGLSVSVVPKERAGMATGIFSTTRVAGEGISLATVGALLAAFMHSGLAAHFSGTDVAQASQRLATGDLQQASRLLPDASVSQLQQIYAASLHHLLLCLVAITLASAVVVLFAMAGKETEPGTATTQKDLSP